MIQPDRTQAPPFQLSKNYSLIQPEIISLSKGKNLFAFRDLQQDVVKLELIFDAGKWHETTVGVSHFTVEMLPKGTAKKTSYQIASRFDLLGAHVEITPGFDVVTISVYMLRKNLASALELLSEILQYPSFNADELRRMKEIFIQGLKVNNEKTSFVASRLIRKVIYGNHPYGTSVEEDDVNSIEQTLLPTFFKKHFSLRAAFLIGRLTDQETKNVTTVIEPLTAEVSNKRDVSSQSGASTTIAKADSVQTSIRLGKRCLAKSSNPQYFDAVMFNHVLGGFFGSRLMKNIREEKGLTYGIYSALQHFLRDSFWVIGAEVNQQNTEKAMEEIRKEIKILQDEPMSEDELEMARNYFIGSWQSENSTLFAVADKFKSIHLWGLPSDYYTHMLQHIQEITPKRIQEIANTHFSTDGLFEVRVG